MAGIGLKSCSLRITCKAGTTASGADSTHTITLKGANQGATADNFMGISDSIQALITTPVLEVIRRDDNLVSEEL